MNTNLTPQEFLDKMNAVSKASLIRKKEDITDAFLKFHYLLRNTNIEDDKLNTIVRNLMTNIRRRISQPDTLFGWSTWLITYINIVSSKIQSIRFKKMKWTFDGKTPHHENMMDKLSETITAIRNVRVISPDVMSRVDILILSLLEQILKDSEEIHPDTSENFYTNMSSFLDCFIERIYSEHKDSNSIVMSDIDNILISELTHLGSKMKRFFEFDILDLNSNTRKMLYV